MKNNYKKYLTIVKIILLSIILTSCTFNNKEVSINNKTETIVEKTNTGWVEETNDLELKGGEALPVESEVEQTLNLDF